MNLLLPSLYLAPIGFYSKIKDQQIIIEQHEFYEKQTYRNRCCIYGANGKLNLIVPITHEGEKKIMKDVKINYDNPWQNIHWKSIQSAYRASSYFEFYEDDFAPFYEKKEKFLYDFNQKLHALILSMLEWENKNEPSLQYEAMPKKAIDLRSSFTPKIITEEQPSEYRQVFNNKHGYIPNLSIVDLLFNMGPSSTTIL